MPQYKIPQQAAGAGAQRAGRRIFPSRPDGGGTAEKYVRLTVFLAAVLFLVGIGSRFPVRAARYGLVGVAGVLLIASVVQLLSLPGPPS